MSEIFSKILKDKNGKVLNVGSMYQQPDWGSETAIVDVLPEATYEIPSDDPMIILAGMPPLVAGKEYAVNYNGTDYVGVAASIEDVIAMGNINALGEGEFEENVGDAPFVVAYTEEAGSCFLVALDGSTTFTLSIKGEGEVIHAIPAKYTETVLRVNASTNAEGNPVLDKTYAQIMEAVDGGVLPYIYTKEGTEMRIFVCQGWANDIIVFNSGLNTIQLKSDNTIIVN